MSHPLTDIHRTNKYGETPAQVKHFREKDSGQYLAGAGMGQCDPGSIPGLSVIHGLGLLLVSHPCSDGFFSMCSDFPFSLKTNISEFQFDLESVLISALCQVQYIDT